MKQPLAGLAITAVLMLGSPALVQAAADDEHGERGDRDRDRDDHHGRAPEPLTVIGLGLGVGGIATARWAWVRRSKRGKRGE